MSEEEELSHNQVLSDVEKQIKAACKLLQRQAARLHEEQQAFDSMSKKMESMQFSSTVKLNVGGHHFTTSIQTLTRDPDSMLAAMFSGRFEIRPSKDGTFFIDRDGTYFRFILNYLRDGKLSLPDGATFLEEIATEAEFYQIQGILDELKRPKSAARSKVGTNLSMLFEESEIMNQEHRQMLLDMLPYRSGKWRLLFRASRDGFEAESFHSKCDNKGPTVTIVKSGSFTFGGFTEVAWKSPPQLGQHTNYIFSGCTEEALKSLLSQAPTDRRRNTNTTPEYVESKEAFLFSLVNPYGVQPVKMPRKSNPPRNNIARKRSLGPVFGNPDVSRHNPYDLKIAAKANEFSESYSHLGGCYECPEGKEGELFLVGTREFLVADYEVFEFY